MVWRIQDWDVGIEYNEKYLFEFYDKWTGFGNAQRLPLIRLPATMGADDACETLCLKAKIIQNEKPGAE
jgi:hypothetical protein